jgi:protein arginine kinase activator
MLCTLCGRNQATIEFEGLIDGKSVKFSLCDECVKSIDIESALNRPHFSVDDLLSALSASMGKGNGSATGADVCSGCGLTIEEFSRDQRPRCPQCLKAFSSRLRPILRKANASNREAALRGAAAALQEDKARELNALNDELRKAVKLEEYERAAVLRDRIKALEKE